MVQGCRYKHEMPSIDKLRDIGFRDIPKWWKEKTATQLRGPTWMQRRLQAEKEEEEATVKPVHVNPAVRSLFSALKRKDQDIPQSKLGKDRDVSRSRESSVSVDKVIDFHPNAPPPSRRGSSASVSSASSADSEDSSVSSVESTTSIKVSVPAAKQDLRHPAAPTTPRVRSPTPVTATPVTKEKPRRPRAQADNDKSVEVAEAPTTVPKSTSTPLVAKAAASMGSKTFTGSGVARSKHAVKPTHETKATYQCRPTEKPITRVRLPKRGTKLAKDLKREKKHHAGPVDKTPVSSPVSLIDL